jgi:Ser/Thr protein kinase RdoA (MazF antagonist)
MDLTRLQQLAARFALRGDFLSARRFGDGHINETLRVKTTEEEYILQRVSSAVFHHPEQVMENIERVIAFFTRAIIARGGDPRRETLSLVPLKEGGTYYIDEAGDAWRVYLFIANTVSYNLPENEEIFRAAAQAFGAFQLSLCDYPADTLHETIPHFHDTPARFAQLMEAAERNAAGRLDGVQAEMEFARRREPFTHVLIRQLQSGRLPLRVTHNDTKLNNVLMDADTGEGVCVIDLDTVMPGLCAYDFGDAIRFGANTALEDEPDLDKVSLSMPLFAAYARGYLEKAASILNAAEIDSLALGAKMMTYECGIRFLADYLNGDTYFRVAYPEHNLVRARNQFRLVEHMEAHMEEMIEICRAAAAMARAAKSE